MLGCMDGASLDEAWKLVESGAAKSVAAFHADDGTPISCLYWPAHRKAGAEYEAAKYPDAHWRGVSASGEASLRETRRARLQAEAHWRRAARRTSRLFRPHPSPSTVLQQSNPRDCTSVQHATVTCGWSNLLYCPSDCDGSTTGAELGPSRRRLPTTSSGRPPRREDRPRLARGRTVRPRPPAEGRREAVLQAAP